MATVNISGPTLADLERMAGPYPIAQLNPRWSGLGLFAAGFHGWNDVVHFANAGMKNVTCVDIDGDKLAEMALVYPEGWEYRVTDAWEYAEHEVRALRKWDVVSVDPFSGTAADRAADTLYLWTTLARHLVTLTVGARTQLNVPDGWQARYMPRSSVAAWMVLTRK